tara:strand:+ start:36 stop:413 length:378 start_codon:yes stop_codon:yes gene_type:complete
MALALVTNSVLDVVWGASYWVLKTTGTGVYYGTSYLIWGSQPSEEEKKEMDLKESNRVILEELNNLKKQIRILNGESEVDITLENYDVIKDTEISEEEDNNNEKTDKNEDNTINNSNNIKIIKIS